MSGIDPQKLERFQQKWSEVALDLPNQTRNDERNIYDIEEGLKEMGLDMTQDATYELIAPGLTRREFVQTQTYLVMLKVLDEFYASQEVDNTNQAHEPYAVRFGSIQRLLEYGLPHFESLYAQEGLPDNVSPVALRQLQLLRDLAADGTLALEMKTAANEWAKICLRNAVMFQRWLEKGDPRQAYSNLSQGKGYAEEAMRAIDNAGDCYQPGPISYERTSMGWGWKADAPKIEFSREAVQELLNDYMLKLAGNKFATALKFQGQGHFVLDSSGGGYGAMVMPMQDILGDLAAHKIDIHDPQTFTAMGTDLDTFWKAYRREREAVSLDQQYSKMVGPEFN